MAGVTPRGIRFPDGNDPIDPASDMEKLAFTADAALGVIAGSVPGMPDLSGISAEINGLKARMASVESGNIPPINNALSTKLNVSSPQWVLGTLNVFGNVFSAADVTGAKVQVRLPEDSTYSPNTRMTENGWLQRISSSSIRYKTNISQNFSQGNDPAKLLKVPVIVFDYINTADDAISGVQTIGFLAEDMAEHFPIGAEFNHDGDPESWNDRTVVPAMLKLVQSLYERVDALEARLAES